MNERLYLGIEIGGTKLQVALGNDHAYIIDRRRYNVVPKNGADGIRHQLQQAITEFLNQHRLSAIGIGFGGPVDWRSGKVSCSHHIEGWSDFDLPAWITNIVRVPVKVDNDANTAAIAEATRGAGEDFSPVFYVTLGSGVGGGLVVNREIYHGDVPGEAEIGHLRLDKSGKTVEQRCSGWAVDTRIREALKAEPNSRLKQLIGNTPGEEARHLTAALEAKDPLAQRILNETAEDLGFALSHATHIVHPQMIVLGGGLSLLGEPLRAAVERYLHHFIMEAFRPGPQVRIAALGEDVVPIGALLLAKQAEAAK